MYPSWAVLGRLGGLPERPMGADCKSVGLRLPRFESWIRHTHDDGRDLEVAPVAVSWVVLGQVPLASGKRSPMRSSLRAHSAAASPSSRATAVVETTVGWPRCSMNPSGPT